MATSKLGSKAEVFRHEGQTWKCLSELASDVVVEVGEMSFHLHKFPLVNRSGLLRKMISKFCGGDAKHCVLRLHDIPGGARAFELVVKFCYDIRIELNASNVVPLRCAADHLLMTEDYVQGNLIMQTESFLNEVVLSSWKYSIEALEECNGLLPHAEQVHVVTRCIDSLVSKACLVNCRSMAGAASSATGKGPQQAGNLWNGIVPAEVPNSRISNWWYATASSLSLPFFKRFVVAIAAKGMEPENVAGFLMFSAKRLLPTLSKCTAPGTSTSASSEEGDQRVALEEIVDLLPVDKGVTPTKFLLSLLRTAITVRASASCRENLERRIGAQLEEAAVEDLLIPNMGKDNSVETLYDVDCVHQILAHFMLWEKWNTNLVDEGRSMAMVAKLVDGYLAEVATDANLTLAKFLSLAAVIPDNARTLHDDIYRAIDIYLKTHPWLTESEKEQICQLVNCQKLSLEACTHAAQNERLPLRLVVQVLFFEQLHLRTSMAACFVVSERMESSQVASNGLVIHASGIEEIQADVISRAQDDNLHVDFDEMRTQVLELQKECLRMKQEIEKLWKPKSSWKVFSRIIGFGIRSQAVGNGK